MSSFDASDHVQPGAQMIYLIRRRSGVTREALVAHWFANHMPDVIAAQQAAGGWSTSCHTIRGHDVQCVFPANLGWHGAIAL